MDRARYKRNYDLHSWIGITLGLIVYVVAFTGCFALFADEIHVWEDPAARLELPGDPAPITPIFESWMQAEADGRDIEFVSFNYPAHEAPYYSAYLLLKGDKGFETRESKWNSATGERLPERGQGLSTWLLDIHRDFMWPDVLGGRTIGRGLVGIAGSILLLAILTGVIAHTKIREEAYSWRLKRSTRLKWQDTHKIVGLWGLPFFLMIAFTGAVLGIVSLLAPIVAAIAFKGDVEALEHTVFGDHAEPAGIEAPMLNLEAFRTIRHPDSGRLPHHITFENYGDLNAVYNLVYETDSELLLVESVSVSGVTGKAIETSQSSPMKPSTRATGAIAPLHYATYGGLWLKFLYFFLGLALAIITALGSMMWIERRKHGNEGSKSAQFYDRLSHLNTGIVMGLPVATLSLFYFDRLYSGAETVRLVAIGWTYFAVWAAALLFAFARRSDYQTTRGMLMLVGLMAIGVPVLDGATTGDWFFLAPVTTMPAHASLNFAMLVAGALSSICALAAPAGRADGRRSKIALDVTDGLSPSRTPAE
jgi:uncharacterized iron-regulated membrane protein